MKIRKLQTSLIVVLTIIGLSVALPKPAYAIIGQDACGNWFWDVGGRIICSTVNTIKENVDIERTAENLKNYATTTLPASLIYGRNASQMGTCGTALFGQTLKDASGADIMFEGVPAKIEVGSTTTPDGTSLMELGQGARDDAAEKGWDTDGVCNFNDLTVAGRNSGSLAATVVGLERTVKKDPIPVNFAYYFQDVAKRTPVVGKAFAATAYPTAIGVQLVLNIWKSVRDISYGIVATLMLITGIMIMTRRRLNPQTVVTAQYALPRIIVAIIGITFSYPIGAIFAGFALPSIIWTIALVFGTTVNDLASADLLNALVNILMSTMGGSGLVMWALIMIIQSFIWILYLVALFKIIFVYLKMLVNIIIAPVIFAWGTIPGNEHLITDWFKKMAAYLVTIPATFLLIISAWYILLKALTTSFFGTNINTTNFGNVLTSGLSSYASLQMTYLLVPFLMITLLASSLQIGKKIEDAFLGTKKGGKR